MAEAAAPAKERPEVSFREHLAVISEIHHRIKGNLQALISIFNLQIRQTADPQMRDLLEQMRNRVRAVANLHEPLFGLEDFSIILFGEYLERLARDLESSYEAKKHVRLELSLADLALDVNSALSLALISNELLSNAFRHAFPNDRPGTISVQLRYAVRADTELPLCELTVEDDGIGLPSGIDFSTAESTGFYVVRLLTRQLRGEAQVQSSGDNGTKVKISFPLTSEAVEQSG